MQRSSCCSGQRVFLNDNTNPLAPSSPLQDEWKNARKFTPPSDGSEFTINELEPSNTYQVRPTWEEGGEVKIGKEMVLDTGVPGCAGSKKKRGCVIS